VNEHHRRFGQKESFPFPLWNGLLEHRKRLGSAIWEFLWCLDKITAEKDGIGFVWHGAPVKARQVAADLQEEERLARCNLQKLQRQGYVQLRRTPYGQVIEVPNSFKFGIWGEQKRTDNSGQSRVTQKVLSLGRDLPKKVSPDLPKNVHTKKTMQERPCKKKNPLYEKEGFSEFWKEYPRTDAKQRAAKAWAKIDLEEHPQVMAGLKRWKRSKKWQKDGGEYILYAVRFLNEERWKEIPMELQATEAGQGQEREMVRARTPA
jgi:hypothetical protein